jgi:ABC-type transport system involved in multi-copper enzyme maturation permease subunit
LEKAMDKHEIYSIGYRRPKADAMGQSPIVPIARTVITTAFAKRTAKVMGAVGLGIFLIHVVWLVGVLLLKKATGDGSPQSGTIIGSTNEIVTTFLWVQYFVTAILVSAIMPGCVSDDRQARCWIVYFSRPLPRSAYAAGKLLGVFSLPFGALVIPTALLSVIAFGVSPPAARPGLVGLLIPSTIIALLGSAVLTTTMVGISARTENSRTAGTVFAGVILGLPLLVGSLDALGLNLTGYLDPARNLRTIAQGWLDPSRSIAGDLVTRVEANDSVAVALIAVVAFSALGIGFLWKELHGDIDV